MLEISDTQTYFDLIACLPMKVVLSDETRSTLDRRGASQSNVFDTRIAPRFQCCGQAIATLVQSPKPLRIDAEQTIVIVRDISRHGMGLLTHEQWFPEQVYHILMPNAEMLLRVVRARYLSPSCFEIGTLTKQHREIEQ